MLSSLYFIWQQLDMYLSNICTRQKQAVSPQSGTLLETLAAKILVFSLI
jgi:hypothetical protein